MLPNKVKIGGIEYEIREEDGMEMKHDALGQIFYSKGHIQLEKDMPDDRKEQILIHEILHGIFYEAGYLEQEEEMITRVGTVLYQVLKDNRFEFGGKVMT